MNENIYSQLKWFCQRKKAEMNKGKSQRGTVYRNLNSKYSCWILHMCENKSKDRREELPQPNSHFKKKFRNWSNYSELSVLLSAYFFDNLFALSCTCIHVYSTLLDNWDTIEPVFSGHLVLSGQLSKSQSHRNVHLCSAVTSTKWSESTYVSSLNSLFLSFYSYIERSLKTRPLK